MIEAYSENIVVPSGSAVPLNSTALQAGRSVVRDGAASFKLTRCGIYEVSCSATMTATAGGLMAIQLVKDQVPQPQSVAGTTAGDTTSSHAMSFNTLVRVPSQSCCAPSPVTIHVENIGVGATFDTIDVVVKKIA